MRMTIKQHCYANVTGFCCGSEHLRLAFNHTNIRAPNKNTFYILFDPCDEVRDVNCCFWSKENRQ